MALTCAIGSSPTARLKIALRRSPDTLGQSFFPFDGASEGLQ
jgi:hypothetical protein